MNAFLTTLFVKIRLMLIAISHWPVIEPYLELLHYQRTGIVIVGTVGTAMVPKLFPWLDPSLQAIVVTVLIAFTLAFFYGLQKEVWKEAEQGQASLPKTAQDWLIEAQKLLDERAKTKLPETRVFTSPLGG